MYQYARNWLFSTHNVCEFSYAVVEIVPLLKPVLGRVLPLMGAVKLDNVQWVFANGEW